MSQRSKKTKTALIILFFCILLAGIYGTSVFMQLNHRNNNGRDYLPQEYAKITLPPTIRFVQKDWDDVHAFDPSLQSIWVYEYDILKSNSHLQVKNDLVTALEKSSYKITDQENNKRLDAYRFTATNSTVHINVDVGYACPYVHCVGDSSAEKVFTSVALSDE